MALMKLLTFCALPVLTHQYLLRSAHSAQQALESTEQLSADRSVAEATGLLNSLEDDISRLWTAMRGLHGSHASLVQLTSELSTANTSSPSAAKPAGAKAAAPHKKGIDATTAVKEMAKLKPGMPGMAPMLGLLTGMYDSWKEKIGDANKKETEQKAAYDKTVKELEAKKAMYKDSKDATDTYDRIEKYWTRQRSIAHRQYHTALKIMHSGMQKFKAVSSAMSNAVAGKKPTAKDLQTVGMAMPDVVLLQVQQLVDWTQEATKDISSARA